MVETELGAETTDVAGRWDFPEGTDVLGSDGAKVGQIVAVHRSYIVVEKGFFFPTDYYIPSSAIADFDGETVRLGVTKAEALDRDWEVAPTDPLPVAAAEGDGSEPPARDRFAPDTGMVTDAPYADHDDQPGDAPRPEVADTPAPAGPTGDPAIDRGIARSEEESGQAPDADPGTPTEASARASTEATATEATAAEPVTITAAPPSQAPTDAAPTTFARAAAGGSQAETYAVGTNTDSYVVPSIEATQPVTSDPASGSAAPLGATASAPDSGEPTPPYHTDAPVSPLTEVGTPAGHGDTVEGPADAGAPDAGGLPPAAAPVGAGAVRVVTETASDDRPTEFDPVPDAGDAAPADATIPEPGFPMDPRNPT